MVIILRPCWIPKVFQIIIKRLKYVQFNFSNRYI